MKKVDWYLYVKSFPRSIKKQLQMSNQQKKTLRKTRDRGGMIG